MITGEIKTKIDQIWDTFHVSGITNPITVLEQMTYIFFMKMLDDKQLQEEAMARDFDTEVKNPTFLVGQNWLNPVTEQEVPYESMRWSVFRHTGPENMFQMVRQNVFEFIKTIGTGEESAYSRYMQSATFLISFLCLKTQEQLSLHPVKEIGRRMKLLLITIVAPTIRKKV